MQNTTKDCVRATCHWSPWTNIDRLGVCIMFSRVAWYHPGSWRFLCEILWSPETVSDSIWFLSLPQAGRLDRCSSNSSGQARLLGRCSKAVGNAVPDVLSCRICTDGNLAVVVVVDSWVMTGTRGAWNGRDRLHTASARSLIVSSLKQSYQWV